MLNCDKQRENRVLGTAHVLFVLASV